MTLQRKKTDTSGTLPILLGKIEDSHSLIDYQDHKLQIEEGRKLHRTNSEWCKEGQWAKHSETAGETLFDGICQKESIHCTCPQITN